MKKKVFVIGAAVLTLGAGSAVLANEVASQGTSYTSFDVIVPGVGNASTNMQTKTNSGASGSVDISSIGGTGYYVEARMTEDGSGSGSWTQDMSESSTAVTMAADPDMLAGDNIYMELQGTNNGTIDIQVQGQWKSN